MKTFAKALLSLILITLMACGSPTPVAPQTIELEIPDPPGPTRLIEIPLGAEVTMRITTAVEDHAHLHGYELEDYTRPGEPIEWRFTANMAGSYELESHVTMSIWANVVVS